MVKEREEQSVCFGIQAQARNCFPNAEERGFLNVMPFFPFVWPRLQVSSKARHTHTHTHSLEEEANAAEPSTRRLAARLGCDFKGLIRP